jgi:hypothetical protein
MANGFILIRRERQDLSASLSRKNVFLPDRTNLKPWRGAGSPHWLDFIGTRLAHV